MANYAYKRTVQTNMKCVGLLDTNKMTITIDDVEKDLSTLLSDFDGGNVELNIKVKDEVDIAEPNNVAIEVAVRE